MKPVFFIGIFLSGILLAACAGTSQPKRAAYTGADNVGAVNAEMIVGKWTGRILNPIKGEDQSAVEPVFEYNSDGTVSSRTSFDSGMGMMEMLMTGTWRIEGDLVYQQAEDIQETSGNALGAMVNLFKGKLLEKSNTSLNIYEASADRVVVVSKDGQAQEWTRIP